MFKNKFHLSGLLIAFAFMLIGFANQANAASFYLWPSEKTINPGSVATVYAGINTQGESVNAADMFLTYNPAEIEITSVRGSSAFESYLAPQYGNGSIRLTAYSVGSSLNGTGTFASISFKSKTGVTSASINYVFSFGSTTDSNIANLSSSDVLSSASGGYYTFEKMEAATVPKDKQPPYVLETFPENGVRDIPSNAVFFFRIKDTQSGVYLQTVRVTINDVPYTEDDSDNFGAWSCNDPKEFCIVIDPKENFDEEEPVYVKIEARDQDGNWMDPIELSFNNPEELRAAALAETIKQKVERLSEECKAKYPELNDSDKDGLDDRTECYLSMQTTKRDTDKDDCYDSDEIVYLNTNPLIEDCDIDQVASSAIITDPQFNWVISKLETTNLSPENSESTTTYIYASNHYYIHQVINSIESVQNIENEDLEEIQGIVNEMVNTVTITKDYTTEDKSLKNIFLELNDKAQTLKTEIDDAIENHPDEIFEVNIDFEELNNELKNLVQDPIIVNTSDKRYMTPVGNKEMEYFELDFSEELEDGFYDLVIESILENKEIITSEPVRFSIDQGKMAQKPIPIMLGEQSILENTELNSETVIEVSYKDLILSGVAEYGTQVFAVWEGDIHPSMTIVDSENGEFSINLPHNLEKEIAHKVTLFTIKEYNGEKIRSESTEIYFKIIERPMLVAWILSGLITLIILILTGYLFGKLISKRGEAKKPKKKRAKKAA